MNFKWLLITLLLVVQAKAQNVKRDNIIWDTPSLSSKGSMPLGNGDIGLNVWVEQNGDLVFLIGKTDSFDEFNRLLKLGRIRIKTFPALVQEGHSFLQTLHLEDGSVKIKTSTAELRVWVDANNPVVQIDLKSAIPLTAQVFLENWRNKSREFLDTGTLKESFSAWGNWPDKMRVNADTVFPAKNGALALCHFNTESQWQRNLELTALGDEITKSSDPVLHRSFGIVVRGNEFAALSNKVLQTKKPATTFSVQIFPLTKIVRSPTAWLKDAVAMADAIKKPIQKRFTEHQKWWRDFWNRSWIEVSPTILTDTQPGIVTRAYNLQRFVSACSGRGALPIKFNGSLFTVEGIDPDYRSWGGGYWFQNTRLAYWPMLYSGDYDMMRPFFNMYLKALPLRKAATKKYYGHEGAFYPETIYFWGNYLDGENYGIDRKGKPDGLTENAYIRRYWQSGIELVTMMLDFYDATRDIVFRDKTLLPFASEIMTFFDQHWKRGSDGKILFDPAQSLETWHVAVNPIPEIVGIRHIGDRLLQLPATPASKKKWHKTLNDLPPVPMITENNLTRLLPAAQYSSEANIENPELYPVFPYRVYTVLADSEKLKIGINTWVKHKFIEDKGWQQNSIQAALLGLGQEVKNMVIIRANAVAPGYRFPGFFGPNYDWTPEQCHGTNLMTSLQYMLIQCQGKRIVLATAWPKDWNAKFKLNAPYNTIVQGSIENGVIKNLKVIPESRRKDVEVLKAQ